MCRWMALCLLICAGCGSDPAPRAAPASSAADLPAWVLDDCTAFGAAYARTLVRIYGTARDDGRSEADITAVMMDTCGELDGASAVADCLICGAACVDYVFP